MKAASRLVLILVSAIIVLLVLIVLMTFVSGKARASQDVTLTGTYKWLSTQDYETPDRYALVYSGIRHSKAMKVDPTLTISVMAIESGFNRLAKSKHGALGSMQVVPKYHRDKLRGKHLLTVNDGAQVGVEILRDCKHKLRHPTKNNILQCYSGYKGLALRKYQHDVLAKYKEIKIAQSSLVLFSKRNRLSLN